MAKIGLWSASAAILFSLSGFAATVQDGFSASTDGRKLPFLFRDCWFSLMKWSVGNALNENFATIEEARESWNEKIQQIEMEADAARRTTVGRWIFGESAAALDGEARKEEAQDMVRLANEFQMRLLSLETFDEYLHDFAATYLKDSDPNKGIAPGSLASKLLNPLLDDAERIFRRSRGDYEYLAQQVFLLETLSAEQRAQLREELENTREAVEALPLRLRRIEGILTNGSGLYLRFYPSVESASTEP